MQTGGPELDEGPDPDCALCPRLHQFRISNRNRFPAWHNAPVPSFGDENVRLLIVGLAPGLKGANRTGRPFTADHAGQVLYQTLAKFQLSSGRYDPEGFDDLALIHCRITNAVRCVPPKNRPLSIEVTTCNNFLRSEINRLRSLRVVLALGTIAHGAILDALQEPKSKFPFRHGSVYQLNAGYALVDSYHCSRLNINTGRLTVEMFDEIFRTISVLLKDCC